MAKDVVYKSNEQRCKGIAKDRGIAEKTFIVDLTPLRVEYKKKKK